MSFDNAVLLIIPQFNMWKHIQILELYCLFQSNIITLKVVYHPTSLALLRLLLLLLLWKLYRKWTIKTLSMLLLYFAGGQTLW